MGEETPPFNKMKVNWKGFRNCHIENDWVLIYSKTDNNELILYFASLGSHSDLGITGKKKSIH